MYFPLSVTVFLQKTFARVVGTDLRFFVDPKTGKSMFSSLTKIKEKSNLLPMPRILFGNFLDILNGYFDPTLKISNTKKSSSGNIFSESKYLIMI